MSANDVRDNERYTGRPYYYHQGLCLVCSSAACRDFDGVHRHHHSPFPSIHPSLPFPPAIPPSPSLSLSFSSAYKPETGKTNVFLCALFLTYRPFTNQGCMVFVIAMLLVECLSPARFSALFDRLTRVRCKPSELFQASSRGRTLR